MAFFLEIPVKNSTEYQLKFKDPNFLQNLAFLVDITQHFNELNLKLQGENLNILIIIQRMFNQKSAYSFSLLQKDLIRN